MSEVRESLVPFQTDTVELQKNWAGQTTNHWHETRKTI